MTKTRTLVFKFPPKVKQRPRMTRRGRVYTPAGTTDFENTVRETWAASEHDTTSEPCRVTIRLRRKDFTVTVTELDADTNTSTSRGDVDNYAKSILDGLQGDGGAFADDRQVLELTISKREKIK
jgi:Holliday junction resolvase RusA-like endonuclease